MLCGLKQQNPPKRRKALSCIANNQQPMPKSMLNPRTTTVPNKSMESGPKYSHMDKENTPVQCKLYGAQNAVSKSRERELLPQALAQLRLIGAENAHLPLDRHTARRLINKHFSAENPDDSPLNTPVSAVHRSGKTRTLTSKENISQSSRRSTKELRVDQNVSDHTSEQPRTSDGFRHKSTSILYENASSSPNQVNGNYSSGNVSQNGTGQVKAQLQLDSYLTDSDKMAERSISKKSISTNCSSVPTIPNSSVDLRCYSESVLRQATKRSRTESAGGQNESMRRRTKVESAGDMCTGKSRAVAIATSMIDRYGIDSRGLLKINVSAKQDRIYVELHEASELKSNWKEICSPFVKVEICPSISGCRSAESCTVYDSNAPKFLQTLELNTGAEDLQKRLVISVWHRDVNKGCCEFLGCLSFGIRHLAYKTRQNKAISGWYHILPESLGHRKHILAVNVQENLPTADYTQEGFSLSQAHLRTLRQVEPSCTSKQQQCARLEQMSRLEDEVSIDLDKTETDVANSMCNETNSQNQVLKTLRLRSNDGYGFTVHSTEPVTVSRVKHASAAYEAGLHAGDVIAAVNQTRTDAYTAREVATLVRQSEGQVILDILCPHYTQSIQQYLSSLEPQAEVRRATGSQQSVQSISSSQCAARAREESRKNTSKFVSSQSGVHSKNKYLSEQCLASPSAYGRMGVTRMDRSQTYSVFKQDNGKMVSESITKWDPSMSLISRCSQSFAHTAYRNDSYLTAINLSSETDRTLNDAQMSYNSRLLDSSVTSDRIVPERRLKAYSTFSLATEAEIVSCQGSTPRRRKRVVRRRLGCKKRLSLSAGVTENLTTPGTEKSISNHSNLVGNRVSIVPYENTPVEFDDTIDSQMYDEYSSYGTKNYGFVSDFSIDESLNSCTLESEYYSDSPQYSNCRSPLKNTLATPQSKHAQFPIEQQRHLADGEYSSGSIDELWLICSPQSHERFVEGIRASEGRFVRAMQLGFSKYLWPARTMLNTQQFRLIFQNMEKLLALSQYMDQQIKAEVNSKTPGHFQTLLDIYANKMPMLLEAYDTYKVGYDTAMAALDASKLHDLEFQQFLQRACAQQPAFSVDEFLLFPLHHVAELLQEFEAVSMKFPEHKNMRSFVEGLQQVLDGVDLEQLENASSCAPSEQEDS